MSKTRSRHYHRPINLPGQARNASIGVWLEPIEEGDHWRVLKHSPAETLAFLRSLCALASETEGRDTAES